MVRLRAVFVPLLGAALLLPFVLIARAERASLAPLADVAVGYLLRVSAPLAAPEAPPQIAADEPAELVFEPAAAKSLARAPKVAAKPPQSLFVGRAAVLKLAQSAARPRGSFVSKSGEHPAGLRLSGVAALGIGLQEGDILTEALGMTPRAAGDVIAAVIEARARRAAALSGTLWRRGQTFHITVEQPY